MKKPTHAEIAAAADANGLKRDSIRSRIARGMSLELAVRTDINWCVVGRYVRSNRLNRANIYRHIDDGMSWEQALQTEINATPPIEVDRKTHPTPTDIDSTALCKRLDNSKQSTKWIAEVSSVPADVITQYYNAEDFSMLSDRKKVDVYRAAGGGV